MTSPKAYIPLLIAQSGPTVGQNWVLAKNTLTIGRDADCDIVIPDRQISRVHARLHRRGPTFEVEDLGSKNGTHVNGARIEGIKVLQDGDVLQIAFVAKLQFVGSEATMPVQAASQQPLDKTPTHDLPAPPQVGGRLRLDHTGHSVWVNNRELDPPLSLPQFHFLELLYQHPGQVCTREAVIDAVWPESHGAGVSEQAIDALVRRTRDRLAELDAEHQYIVTMRGHGFRLDNPSR